jgi:hypothetical protein
MTATEIQLFSQLRDQPTLLTQILKLKLAGKTHQQIASALGYSKSYIDNLHSIHSRQFKAISE